MKKIVKPYGPYTVGMLVTCESTERNGAVYIDPARFAALEKGGHLASHDGAKSARPPSPPRQAPSGQESGDAAPSSGAEVKGADHG